jgi:hypothetical protein
MELMISGPFRFPPKFTRKSLARQTLRLFIVEYR